MNSLYLLSAPLSGADPIAKPALVIACAGGFVLIIAWLLLYLARRKDERNWILERAPSLPISLVNARDDVWLRGRTRTDTPLVVPHFGEAAVAFRYKLEQKVTETVTDSKGNRKTRTRWVTREDIRDAVDFELVEGDHSIHVHAGEAELLDLPRLGPDYEAFRNYRHSASYLPHPGTVSVMGSVDDHRAWIEKYLNIPLLITPRRKTDFLRSAERAESALRWSGFILQFVAFSGLFYAGGLKVGLPRAATHAWSVPQALLGTFLGLCGFFCSWTLYVFNSMVLYRNRTKTAWKQIDVDLKNRYDLIPRLCEVVSGAIAHEQALFETLTRLRAELAGSAASTQIARETEVSAQVGRLIALKEAYPDLTTNPLYQMLDRELTALEEKIAHARGFFNGCVTEYNTLISQWPRALVARLCGFAEWPLFRIEDAAEKNRPRLNVLGPRS